MDALLPSRRWHVRGLADVLRGQVARPGLVLLVGLLCGVALTLVVRRATGALERPLAATSVSIVAAILAAAVTLVRIVGNRIFGRRACLVVHVATTTSLLCIGLALSLPGSSPAGVAVFWLVLIAAECAVWVPWGASHWSTRVLARHAERLVNATQPQPSSSNHGEWSRHRAPEQELLQQTTRTRADDGTEVISGWIGAEFAVGQRTMTAHVAFCPPFVRMPAVEVLANDVARVKVAQALPHGARFDVKLNAPAAERLLLPLRFKATCGA